MLFYDPYGGCTIGGIWNPSLQTLRPFRVLLGFSSKPAGGEEAVAGKTNGKVCRCPLTITLL